MAQRSDGAGKGRARPPRVSLTPEKRFWQWAALRSALTLVSPLRETGLWFQVGVGESEAALATLRFGFSPVKGEGLDWFAS